MKNHVILTGGTGGLGSKVLEYLLSKDWDVSAFVRSEKSEDRLKDLFKEDFGKRLHLLKADLTSEEQVQKTLKNVGSFNALVHLAGGFKAAKTMGESAVEDLNHLIKLNVLSSFVLLRNILPKLKEQKDGSIVMIGAKPALYPSGANAAYAASKAALTTLVLSAAEEGRPDNVSANIVVPAVIDTPENRKWATDKTPVEKWTSPENIAEVIGWLISQKGRRVTGSVIPMYNKLKTF